MNKLFARGGEEQKMFKEFYELAQDYFIPEHNDAYWESYVRDLNKFVKNNIPFARELAMALTSYLEKIYRNGGTNNADA